jgi:hypothetical protein
MIVRRRITVIHNHHHRRGSRKLHHWTRRRIPCHWKTSGWSPTADEDNVDVFVEGTAPILMLFDCRGARPDNQLVGFLANWQVELAKS